MPMPRPKPWNMGIIESMLMPGLKQLAMDMVCMASALKLRFESIMPLLTPVVPPL